MITSNNLKLYQTNIVVKPLDVQVLIEVTKSNNQPKNIKNAIRTTYYICKKYRRG